MQDSRSPSDESEWDLRWEQKAFIKAAVKKMHVPHRSAQFVNAEIPVQEVNDLVLVLFP